MMLDDIKRAVMFCAHTDDEMIAAGTLHRLARHGTEIHVIAMSTAGTKEDPDGGLEAWKVLEPEWRASMKLIGAYAYLCGVVDGLVPSKQLHDHGQKIADLAFRYICSVKPDLVISLSPDDENTAHAVVGTQVRRVSRGRVPMLIECQYPWNHSLGRPNLFVKLSVDNLTAKQRVIRAYSSQTFRYQYEAMLLAACKLDGLSVKVEQAEKFEILRCVT